MPGSNSPKPVLFRPDNAVSFRCASTLGLLRKIMAPRPPTQKEVYMVDPSEVHRPEKEYEEYKDFKAAVSRTDKSIEDFRNFGNNLQTEIVYHTYKEMHQTQTLDYVKQKIEYWGKLDKKKMTIMDAVFLLDALVDESDPDTDLPNSMHAFQTAERIRKEHPDNEWFQLVGLLHDLGKVMALWGEPQFSVVGDTFPLGCKFSPHIVFPKTLEPNPDCKVPEYSTKYGIYEPNCGLAKVFLSWGHDEYMFHVLTGNGCSIPEEGLYCIRYHSFYPWHCSGDYEYLMDDKDRETLKWVKEFNKFDLYSKSDEVPDIQALKPYYQELIDKYCPGEIRW